MEVPPLDTSATVDTNRCLQRWLAYLGDQSTYTYIFLDGRGGLWVDQPPEMFLGEEGRAES